MCNTNDFNIDAMVLADALGDDVSDGVVEFAAMDVGHGDFGREDLFFVDGEGLTSHITNLTEIAAEREDPWNEYPAVKPDTSDVEPYSSKRLIVESNRGVDVASYHQLPRGWVFQDRSGDDEGMYGRHDEPYTVYRWMELPEGKCEKE